jgi:hypothetical protein
MFDRGTDQVLLFRDGWQAATPATVPAGGAVIDVEARAAIGQLLEALHDTGILAASAS